MLPEIPNQYPILQQWVGLGSFILVVFGIFVSWRKILRGDRPGAAEPPSPVANMPKYYLEGPIVKMFDLLHEINGRLKDIQRHIKEDQPPGRRH